MFQFIALLKRLSKQSLVDEQTLKYFSFLSHHSNHDTLITHPLDRYLLSQLSTSPLLFTLNDFSEDENRLIQEQISCLCLKALSCMFLTNYRLLVNKVELAKTLQRAGLLGVLAPPTFLVSTNEELQHSIVDFTTKFPLQHQPKLWYLKDPLIQRGQGIHIFSPSSISDQITMLFSHGEKEQGSENHRSGSQKTFCLQPSHEDLMLLNGKKFGLRVHALVIGWSDHILQQQTLSVFAHQDSVVTKCASEFSAADSSLLAQITCTSVQRGLPGYNRSAVKGPGSLLIPKYYTEILPRLKHAISLSIQAVNQQLHKWRDFLSSPASPSITSSTTATIDGMQVFGFDFLLSSKGTPILLEINASPQVGDPQSMDELRQRIGIPLINGIPFVLNSILNPMTDHRVGVPNLFWDWVCDFLKDESIQG